MESFEKFQRLKNIRALFNSLSLEPEIKDNNLTIRTISNSDISERSYGEVENSNTVNYRTLRFEKGGIFCERIFGPERNYECSCGKYKGIRFKGIICDRCRVKITKSDVRDKRTGHIALANPVVHPYFKDHLARVLGIEKDKFDETVYYDGEDKDMKEIFNLKAKTPEKTKEADMILDNILVLPANKRPLVCYDTEEGENFAASDVNALYRRVIDRNLRLKKLKELHAPLAIMRNEARMLQGSIDDLFLNEQAAKPYADNRNKPLTSLTGMLLLELKCFWMNRCDYSGRSVVISNPGLLKNECELPQDILMELYTPLVIYHLKKNRIVDMIRSAKGIIERKSPAAIEALKEAISSRPVVVTYGSKATAFYPKIGENNALAIHPEACKKLEFRMDGKEASFHLPLSKKAVKEARSLVGQYAKGKKEYKIRGAFSSLFNIRPVHNPRSIQPIIRAVTQEKSLPLSRLERNLIKD